MKHNKQVMTTREEVLKRLKATYCRLQCSPVSGVGVFAIRDIPVDTDPFPYMHDEEWVTLSSDDIVGLDPSIRDMVDAFFVIEPDGSVSMPKTACSNLDVSFYINHSTSPNVMTVDNGFTFRTLREIRFGEELLVDYRTYDHKWGVCAGGNSEPQHKTPLT